MARKRTGLYRRDKWWWADFSVNGQRYRVSLETTDWRKALALKKEKEAEARQGKLAPSSQQFARLAFPEAADRFLADRLAYLAPRNVQREKECLVPLKAFYRATPLMRITAETILAYPISPYNSSTDKRQLYTLKLNLLQHGTRDRAGFY